MRLLPPDPDEDRAIFEGITFACLVFLVLFFIVLVILK